MAKKRKVVAKEPTLSAKPRIAGDEPQEVGVDNIPKGAIKKPPIPMQSEYETIRSKIAPHVSDTPLSELSSTHIRNFSREMNVPVERLEELASADKLARTTHLPPELFFGLSRQGLPSTLDALLVEDPKKFRETLDRAIESKQISRSEDTFPGAVNRLGTLATE